MLMRTSSRFFPRGLILLIALGALAGLALFLFLTLNGNHGRDATVWAFITNPRANQRQTVEALSRCGETPYLMPTSGLIGYIWDDSFYVGHRHQGLDIFGGTEVGVTPVYAAASGYLTRLSGWAGSLIIRIPSDELNPGTQVWNYYTHLADAAGNSFIEARFYPGILEEYVEAGTLLGYQGNFSGDPNNPVGVHLHFSIVRDDDWGNFTNELEIGNTLDPSPYFGMEMNANTNPNEIPTCE